VVVLGVEATGFLPVRDRYGALFTARSGETDFGLSRPWCAGAGRSATFAALPLLPKLLSDLRPFAPAGTGHLDFESAATDPAARLVLFEAFVTSPPRGVCRPAIPLPVAASSSPHVWDAAVAIECMAEQLRTGLRSAIKDVASLSFFGAALLAARWSVDVQLASTAVHVVRGWKPARGAPVWGVSGNSGLCLPASC
jgi:hypothetical protein